MWREKIKVKYERSDTRNNQKQWRSIHISYYPLRLSTYVFNNSLMAERIFMKFDTEIFTKYLSL